MHHILNVEQIRIENLFIECDYHFFKSSRRAVPLLAELKYGFFNTGCHGVCNSAP